MESMWDNYITGQPIHDKSVSWQDDTGEETKIIADEGCDFKYIQWQEHCRDKKENLETKILETSELLRRSEYPLAGMTSLLWTMTAFIEYLEARDGH